MLHFAEWFVDFVVAIVAIAVLDGGGLGAAFALRLSPASFRSIATFW